MVIGKPMEVTRKNSTTSTLLTHAKRASFVYLIMPSFMFAIALNTQSADAQSVEFILQFGTPEEDSTTAAQGVFAHSSGVYVVGNTDGTLPDQTSEGGTDAFIRKYDSDGDEIWTRQFVIEIGIFVAGVSTDSEGGVYVAGNDGDSTFVFVRKYNLDGDEQWTRQFDTASSEDIVRGVSADASSVYVVGETGGTFPGQTKVGFIDAFLAKLIEDDDDEDDKRKKHHDDGDKKEKH